MPDPIEREIFLWADLNSADADHRIVTSLRFASGHQRPRQGEWVRLYDDEGNTLLGTVELMEDMVVHVRPAMETWTYSVSVPSPFEYRPPAASPSDPVSYEPISTRTNEPPGAARFEAR
jgi:hypothetical protein